MSILDGSSFLVVVSMSGCRSSNLLFRCERSYGVKVLMVFNTYRGLRLAGAPNLIIISAVSVGFVVLLVLGSLTYLQIRERIQGPTTPEKDDMTPFLRNSEEA